MTSPAPRRQAQRWAWAPERVLAWLSLGGLACYGALRLVHQAFYSTFGVSIDMVGVGQAQMVTAAAVLALLLVALLAYPVVFARLLFSRAPRGRIAVLEAAFSAVLLVGAGLLWYRVAPLRDALLQKRDNTNAVAAIGSFVVLAGLLGLLVFWNGLSGYLAGAIVYHPVVYQRIRSAYKWWLLRRYLGRAVSADAILATYLPARRAARRRAARRRAAWRRDRQAVGRTVWLVFVAILGAGLFYAVVALTLTAQQDAQAQIAGRKHETIWLYDLLTPGAVARPVEVIAQDPRLRSLEKAQVLYLGTHDGMQVLYDRTKKHAVLVPGGSVTLILPSR